MVPKKPVGPKVPVKVEPKKTVPKIATTRTCKASYGSGIQTKSGSTWGACKINSCIEGFQLTGGKCHLLASPVKHVSGAYDVPVHFMVVRNSKGQGNEKWVNSNFLKTVLNKATELSQIANFKLASVSEYRKDKLFYSNKQYDSLKYITRYRTARTIRVIISGEKTVDAAGIAWLSYASHGSVFAMRSRYNTESTQFSAKAIDNNARIFLHELGHTTNLKHKSKPYNPDTFYKQEDGRKHGKKFIKRLMNFYIHSNDNGSDNK